MPCGPSHRHHFLGLIAAGLLLLAVAPASSGAAPSGQVWGLALPATVKTVKQSQANWLAGRRVTTVVAVGLPQKSLTRLVAAAKRSHLNVIAPRATTPRKACKSTTGTLRRCAALAGSPKAAVKLARRSLVDYVVVFVRTPLQLRMLRGSGAVRSRIVAVLPLRATAAGRSAWRAGIAYATTDPALDLAVSSSPAASGRLGSYLSLLPRLKKTSQADTQAPTVPQGMAFSGKTPTTISLVWKAASDNVAVTGYRLFRNGTSIATVTTPGYTYTGLTCGTSYTFALAAYDEAGNTSNRAEATGSTATAACTGGGSGSGDSQAPSQPSALVAAGVTASSATLSWTASTDNVGVSGYGRYRNGTLLSGGAGTSYSFTGLSCNTNYTLAVDAYDAAGNRSSRASTSVTTSGCPPSGGGGGLANVYLSPSGSDSSACTQAAPCRSFDRGYRVAAPGGVVEVAGGSYPAQTLTTDSSKTSSSDVVFRPASGASVILGDLTVLADHLEIRDLTLKNSASTKASADDVTLRNIDMLGFVIGGTNISVIGGRVHCGVCDYHPQISAETAADVTPTNILIDSVLFEDWQSASAAQHTECLQIGGGNGITIRNSTFRQCSTATPNSATAAIHVSWYGLGPVTKNILIENNFIYASGNSFTIQAGDYDNFDLRYNSIAGPIVVFNREGGGTGMDFIGNNMGFAVGGCTAENSGVPINWRYNLLSGGTCGATDRNAPNGFIDRNTNLHLAPGAAAIDRGDRTSYPATDIDGNSRSGVPDAGADER